MAAKWVMPSPIVLTNWILVCSRSKKINDGEKEFLVSIGKKLAETQQLTVTQCEKLEQIYANKT